MDHHDVLRLLGILYGREGAATHDLSNGATVSVLRGHGRPRDAAVAADRLVVCGDFNLDARDVPPVLEIGRNTPRRQLVRVTPSRPTCCFGVSKQFRFFFDYFLVSDTYRVQHIDVGPPAIDGVYASDHLPAMVTLVDVDVDVDEGNRTKRKRGTPSLSPSELADDWATGQCFVGNGLLGDTHARTRRVPFETQGPRVPVLRVRHPPAGHRLPRDPFHRVHPPATVPTSGGGGRPPPQGPLRRSNFFGDAPAANIYCRRHDSDCGTLYAYQTLRAIPVLAMDDCHSLDALHGWFEQISKDAGSAKHLRSAFRCPPSSKRKAYDRPVRNSMHEADGHRGARLLHTRAPAGNCSPGSASAASAAQAFPAYSERAYWRRLTGTRGAAARPLRRPGGGKTNTTEAFHSELYLCDPRTELKATEKVNSCCVRDTFTGQIVCIDGCCSNYCGPQNVSKVLVLDD
jgi:hypothetical protein